MIIDAKKREGECKVIMGLEPWAHPVPGSSPQVYLDKLLV